jgi:L-alanine-DL-glutamate epimerase-like enolase superfamily enzyme
MPVSAKKHGLDLNAPQKLTDVRVVSVELFLLPVRTRMPLKFGPETLTSVTCARVRIGVEDRTGRQAFGWGETPLSVQWAWPAKLSIAERHDALVRLSKELVAAWSTFGRYGHPMELGHDFQQLMLPELRRQANEQFDSEHRIPLLAALVCLSPFDIALHDAYGILHNVPVYETYNRRWMNRDLSSYLQPAEDATLDFSNIYPDTFLLSSPNNRLPAWHLVAGLDPLDTADAIQKDPRDGLPVLLTDWIAHDGLFCLKVKLRGDDRAWDYSRLARVGRIAIERGVRYLSADFNCTVENPDYVNDILDRLATEEPEIDRRLLYVEQPFPYELQEHRIDVHSVAARKPLFMDESAHDWQHIRLGRELGWTGVALKTCKTQTGALLSFCWAKAHGMQVMVQDLTNPMLAQVPHLLLAAHAGTIMGVETNAMQFYPEASQLEAQFLPGLYSRDDGYVDCSAANGVGLGYAGAALARSLPAAVASSHYGSMGSPHFAQRPAREFHPLRAPSSRNP